MRLDKYATYEALVTQAQAKTDIAEDLRSSRKKRIGDDKWDDGMGYEQSIHTAITGDTLGASKLSRSIVEGANTFRMTMGRLDPEYRTEEGHWIDIDRYVRGEPEVWGAMVETGERTVKKSVSLVINVGVCFVTTAAAVNRVAVNLASAILGLQSMGYTVMVYLGIVNSVGQNKWVVSSPVNFGGGALDISRLSAVLRPWFFRRVIFSLWETADKETRDKFWIYRGGGYGHIDRLTGEMLEKITGDKDAVAIDVDRYLRDITGENLRRDILFSLNKGANNNG